MPPATRPLGDPGRIRFEQGSYVLRVLAGELDAERFWSLRQEGTDALGAGEPDKAARLLRQAIEHWRGEPFTGLESPSLVADEAVRLTGQRLTALEDLYTAEIRRGTASAIVTELAGVAARNPLRERLSALLMVALQQCGRRAEALEIYRHARDRLVDELGLEPGPELRRTHEAILTDELPDLVASSTGAGRTGWRRGTGGGSRGGIPSCAGLVPLHGVQRARVHPPPARS